VHHLLSSRFRVVWLASGVVLTSAQSHQRMGRFESILLPELNALHSLSLLQMFHQRIIEALSVWLTTCSEKNQIKRNKKDWLQVPWSENGISWYIDVYWCIDMYSHPTIINPTSKNHPQASSIEIGGLVDGLRHGRYLHLAPGPMESCEGWARNGWIIARCWNAIWLKYVEMAHIHETWDIFQRLVECWRYLNAKKLHCERNSVADPLYRNNKNRLSQP
jgi:hypothetical protein